MHQMKDPKKNTADFCRKAEPPNVTTVTVLSVRDEKLSDTSKLEIKLDLFQMINLQNSRGTENYNYFVTNNS